MVELIETYDSAHEVWGSIPEVTNEVFRVGGVKFLVQAGQN